jgi:hypothetical protein
MSARRNCLEFRNCAEHPYDKDIQKEIAPAASLEEKNLSRGRDVVFVTTRDRTAAAPLPLGSEPLPLWNVLTN